MRREHLSLDMFPFLAVLMAFLGAMLTISLVFVSMSTLFPSEVWEVNFADEDSDNGSGSASGGDDGGEHVPVVVELSGDGVTIHPDMEVVPTGAAFRNNGDNSSRFGQLIGDVRKHPKEKFLFAIVRPSGFDSLGELRFMADPRGVLSSQMGSDEFMDELLNEMFPAENFPPIDLGYEPATEDQKIRIRVAGGESQ